MKKRIDTLSYDTETANKLGEWSNNLPDSEFEHCREILYKKRTGEYFLYGEGGAMSKYHKPAYGSSSAWRGGEDIIPLSKDQAQKWFEKANNDDEDLAPDEVYDREFGHVKGKGDLIHTTINIHENAMQKLERIAHKQGIPKQEVIENLILEAN